MSTKRFLIKIQILWRSVRRSFHKKFDGPVDVLTEKEKAGMQIFITGLNDNNNIRLLSSDDNNKKYIVSLEFYIKIFLSNLKIESLKLQENETYLIFTGSKMTVVNHIYSYDVDFPNNTVKEMNKMFERAVKRDRLRLENAVDKNSTNGLTEILVKFQKRQNENARFVADNEKIS
jgi:hypothetical protein